jgi:hypothetical protein
MKRGEKFRYLALFLLILLGLMKNGTSFAQKSFDNKTLNIGIKAGLNALSSTHYEIYFDDVLLNGGDRTNKYGYLFNTFVRINLDRFFMQPEIEWDHYRQEFNFALPISLEENIYGREQTLEINENALNLCVLAGFHIVKTGPYIINCFLGGSIRTNYKTEYKFKSNFSSTEYNQRYNYTGIIGSSLNISIIHFDVRYHFNFPNTNMSNINSLANDYQGISFRKNENILSFSCGAMF